MASKFGKTGHGSRNAAAARELGNIYVKRGITRSVAMKLAWKAVKAGKW